MTAIALTDLMKDQKDAELEQFKVLEDIHQGFFPGTIAKVSVSMGSAFFTSFIHSKDKWFNGIEHNDPMRTQFCISKLGNGKYSVELTSGETLCISPAPGSIYAFDSVPCKFRKSRGDLKAIIKKITAWEEQRQALVEEYKDRIK